MLKRLLISLFAILMAFHVALAGPAQPGAFILTQPDGYRFEAILRGDEYTKILTTGSGEAITMEEDGWYCYARYDWTGAKLSTGVRVEAEKAPQFILSAAREIPYRTLSAKAQARRNTISELRTLRRNSIRPREGTRDKHGIIILAQFADLKFKYTRDHFLKLITSSDEGSAITYYNTQFGGTVNFNFDISEIVTLPSGFAYYGKNDPETDEDVNAHEMVAKACELADPSVDFSLYDDDGDGYVDNVFVYFAGGDEAGGAGEDHIWSHMHYLSTDKSQITLDGVTVDNYACTSELVRGSRSEIMATIGTFCHEYMHTFGLPDYYDTDYEESGGKADALWRTTALMDGGNWNDLGRTPPNLNAVDRYLLGLSEPTMMSEGTYTLNPIGEDGAYLKYDHPSGKEFYLMECRYAEGWDKYIGGSGLLIYHIDMSDSNVEGLTAKQRWGNNKINCVPAHQCLDLVEAMPGATSVEEVFFPRGGNNRFTPGSYPTFSWWDGSFPPVGVTYMDRRGKGIVLDVGQTSDERAPDVTSVNKTVLQDAAIITWQSDDTSYKGVSYIAWAETGKTPVEYSVAPYSSGHYAFVLEELSPGKSYNVSLYFKSGAVRGKESTAASLITKTFSAKSIPYIYLTGIGKNDDGSFPSGVGLPLRVYNSPDADGVKWYYEGSEIKVGPDGYFHPSSSGTLRAVVMYSDGSSNIIQRSITLK